jgi:Protein of unknown function (DUF4242)
MKKYLIERELPGAGKLTPAQLKSLARKSCEALESLDAPYHWVQSFVTDNKIYCIHIAPDKETVLEHARIGGFPANSIVEVRTSIDPTTSLTRV